MGQWLKGYGTIAITAATVVGYAVGYSSVAWFARELGVSVGDLDADLRDYLLLAGINIAIWSLAILALVGLSELGGALSEASDNRRKRSGKRASAISFLFTLMLLLVGLALLGAFVGLAVAVQYVSIEADVGSAMNRLGANSARGFWLSYVVGTILICVPGLRRMANERLQMRRQRHRWWETPEPPGARRPSALWKSPAVLVTWATIIIVMSTWITLVGSAQWAKDIKEWGKSEEDEPDSPVGLNLILQPELGEATRDGSTEVMCAVRVSDRVLASTSVVVADDVTSFESKDC